MTERSVSSDRDRRPRIAEAAGRLGGLPGRLRGSRRRAAAGLSIFGVLLGGVLAAAAMIFVIDVFQSAREDQRRSDAVALLQRIRANVEKVHAGNPAYGTASLVPTLSLRGMIPENALKAVGAVGGTDDTIEHMFGGAVNVVGATRQFTITFVAVEADVCAALADGFVGRSRSRSGLAKINRGSDYNSPLTRANVQTACTYTGTSDVAFTFG